MTIYAIDPGPEASGVVIFDGVTQRVLSARKDMENRLVISMLREASTYANFADAFGCECIEAMYAHVGKETVRTIRFCGAIEEAVVSRGGKIAMLSPQEVKKRVCGTASAKDPAVRQALIDRLGPPGTKKRPGPTFGVSSHAWRALAVAVAVTIKPTEALALLNPTGLPAPCAHNWQVWSPVDTVEVCTKCGARQPCEPIIR